jgi:hypothetical protein
MRWLLLLFATTAAAHDIPTVPLTPRSGAVGIMHIRLDTPFVSAEDCPAHPEGVPACVHSMAVVNEITTCQVLIGQAYFDLTPACKDAIDGHMYVDCIQTGHTPTMQARIQEVCSGSD